ncbi:MAG: hypothetical protein K2W96_23940 [Gemmataceae bacterium]|nr:hypothetical protein [Gemmataceae bacterium]
MSATPTAPPHAPRPPAETPNEVTVISHSNILYWWPVWACGFIMAIVTYIDGRVMATMPEGTKALKRSVKLDLKGELKEVEREVLVLPEGRKLSRTTAGGDTPQDPHILMSGNKSLGVIFFTVLLLVVFITNVPLRGMWSFLIIILIVLLSLILHLAGWWGTIAERLSLLDVRINMGGYLFLSTVLLIIWCLAVFVFDKRVYIVFTPGQFRVCTEIGGGEKVYDTMGMKMEKQQSDLFRHYFLGLGAGDLIVKTSGATNEHFDLHNVLWINQKVARIEEMLQKKKMVSSH